MIILGMIILGNSSSTDNDVLVSSFILSNINSVVLHVKFSLLIPAFS